MTLAQLSAFVLTARLGSVRGAARVLNVTEPAVSQAIRALRHQLGDPLLVWDGTGMKLTEAGARLLPLAARMVALGAEAEAVAAGRPARDGSPGRGGSPGRDGSLGRGGSPGRGGSLGRGGALGRGEGLRLVTGGVIAEFVAAPLTEAFARRRGDPPGSVGVAETAELAALVAGRLADAALGPRLGGGLLSEPVLRYQLVTVASPRFRPRGSPRDWPWLVGPSGTDPGSDVAGVLRAARVPQSRVRVYPNQAAAWAAAADGAGVAPAAAHLVSHQLRRGELRLAGLGPVPGTWYATTLPRDQRPVVASALRQFLSTPAALRLMREPGGGVPAARFRPQVRVTIWS